MKTLLEKKLCIPGINLHKSSWGSGPCMPSMCRDSGSRSSKIPMPWHWHESQAQLMFVVPGAQKHVRNGRPDSTRELRIKQKDAKASGNDKRRTTQSICAVLRRKQVTRCCRCNRDLSFVGYFGDNLGAMACTSARPSAIAQPFPRCF